jgi:glycosyltransferase involved in cell wall biosynthesis
MLVTGAYFPEFSAGGLQARAIAHAIGGDVDFSVLTTATDSALASSDVVDGILVSRVFIDVSERRSTIGEARRMLSVLLKRLPHLDVIHIQGFSAKNIVIMLAAKLAGRPVIQHLQTSRHDEPAAIRAQGRAAWWAFASADRYLSVSAGLTTAYLEGGLAADRIRQVPNGVDVDRFAPADAAQRLELRRRLGLPGDRPLVLFVGVIAPDKRPDVLFDAWLQLQADPTTASTLVLVGATNPDLYELGDRLGDRLRSAASSSGFGDRVVFAPPTHDIQDYFRAADIYAMPSAREGSPIALLEAMSCALPCVASRLPGSTDDIIDNDRNGILVPSGDANAFAGALRSLLLDRNTAAALGARARETVLQRFSFQRIAEQWLAAYRDVLAAA